MNKLCVYVPTSQKGSETLNTVLLRKKGKFQFVEKLNTIIIVCLAKLYLCRNNQMLHLTITKFFPRPFQKVKHFISELKVCTSFILILLASTTGNLYYFYNDYNTMQNYVC